MRFRKASRPPHIVRRARPLSAQCAPGERRRSVAHSPDCDLLCDAGEPLFAAELLSQIFRGRAFRSAARGKDRTQDSISKSARGRSGSNCERHRRRSPLSGPQPDRDRLRNGDDGRCGDGNSRLPRRHHPARLADSHGGAGEEHRTPPTVEIVQPSELIGRSTVESIQSGLYFGNRAMVRELTREIRLQTFAGAPPAIIGTGGFVRLFERESLFDLRDARPRPPRPLSRALAQRRPASG